MTSRRRFLGLLAGAAVIGTTGFVVGSQAGNNGLLRSKRPLPQRFTVPLPIPQAAKPTRVDGTTEYYTLVQRTADVEILPGVRTRIWGYDGTFPGPTFHLRHGRQAVVELRNELDAPTSMHLHGGVTPPESDGYPTDLVKPAATKEYTYPMRQRAATLWYHDHRMDYTAPQVWRGLAGLCLVSDAEEENLGLPTGRYDVPLLLTDRAFDEDGSFLYPALHHGPGVEKEYANGVLGDVMLVNGVPWPVHEVEQTRYRFRIVNGSNARRYDLALEPGGDLIQIGSDAGLLDRPRKHRKLTVSPGERFDVLVDFAGYPVGTEITLGSLVRFKVVRPGPESPPLPEKLAGLERLGDPVATRTFDFRTTMEHHGARMWTINGEMFDPAKSLATPQLGTVERWRLSSDFHHPVHLHLAHFQVVSRGGKGPAAQDVGWKDTVDVRPYEVVEVLARFDGYRGRYMMHCHNLEHEDMAMMANFFVG
ncbi:multicopper oxidase family protein [Kibdelosporangium persicum]|uniref:Multicopper oxidase CueO n=1 Tax=Kibdelosporangium persicum TaxID=2698649 RepID=A0ABX2EWC3_9PSEU|nr:multicopper oxidase domain-containing protein [Kibdelosporangium persicum]NRN63292.1 Multicopper oxidase with three cupredoxin domains [Kibdelosporangium persicum]